VGLPNVGKAPCLTRELMLTALAAINPFATIDRTPELFLIPMSGIAKLADIL